MNIVDISSRFAGVREHGDIFLARCPSHVDSSLALELSENEGKTILRCQAGCQTEAVLAAAGLSPDDLVDQKSKPPVVRRRMQSHPERRENVDSLDGSQTEPRRSDTLVQHTTCGNGNLAGLSESSDVRYLRRPIPSPSSGGPAKIAGFRCLADVPSQHTEYLWHGRIPFGEITILEGHPGTNKSSVCSDLAARLTRGVAMPCSDHVLTKAGAVFLIGEDSVPKTVRSRLEAAGADLSRIGVLEGVSIPDGLLTVERAIHRLGAKLVVVDTLNDFLLCNVLGNQAVRKALRPLRDLAERTNVAVVVLRHFVKNGSGASLLRGGGSVGITAVARSQLKLFKHPDDPNLRVLIQDKNNLGPHAPSLLFGVEPEGESFRLDWHGESDLTIEDIEKAGKGCPKLKAAEQFLLDHLASGRKEVNWLLEASRGLCSKRTLDEAKKSLGLQTIREGQGENHTVYWQLPDYSPSSETIDPDSLSEDDC